MKKTISFVLLASTLLSCSKGDGPSDAPDSPIAPAGVCTQTPAQPRYIERFDVSGSGSTAKGCAITDVGVRCWGKDIESPCGLKNPRAIATDMSFSCALTDEGLKCWSVSDKKTSFPSGLEGATSLSAQNGVACAVTRSGQVKCWGNSFLTSRLAVPTDLPFAHQVTVGRTAVCATLVSGVRCWGEPSEPIVQVPIDLGAVSKVAIGMYDACAIQSGTGRVRCWGGRSYADSGISNVPSDLQGVRDLVVEHKHACVIKSDRRVLCWGKDAKGNLDVPSDLDGAMQLSVSDHNTCALTSDGIRCWGVLTNLRKAFSSLSPSAQYDLDYAEMCAVDYGKIRCFSNTGEPSATMQKVADWSKNGGETSYRAVVLSRKYGLCALAQSGRVKCTYGFDSTSPVFALSFRQLVAGDGHFCAVTAGGQVFCWGDNNDGQTDVPPNVSGVSRLAAGLDSTCAWMPGRVQCWGTNSNLQAEMASKTLINPDRIAFSNSHICAQNGNQISCHGRTYGNEVNPTFSEPILDFTNSNSSVVCALTATAVKCWHVGYAGYPELTSTTDMRKYGAVKSLVAHNYGFCVMTETNGLVCRGSDWASPETEPPQELIGLPGLPRTY